MSSRLPRGIAGRRLVAVAAAVALLAAGAVTAAALDAHGVARAPAAPSPATRAAAPAPAAPAASARTAARGTRRLAFAPADPYIDQQWYLDADQAFGAWAHLDAPPALAPVRVAVIDSGIDFTHPDFKGRIAAARSFVGPSAQDTDGHGTFVAGIIAAALDNEAGIAGMAFPAKLLVAKVVGRDGTISPEAEARAIRWAADNGARVINMSIGGLRDPRDPARDTFSRLEASAVAYAVSKGAVVVAAAGNADDAPATPWPFASYPAALPHVVGVAALTRKGDVSSFSDRDPVHVDIAAPGEGIVSTFPLALTAKRVGCVEQGTSLCGPGEYRDAEGTSFAAPQVTAAIALVLAAKPGLTAGQAAEIVQRSAADVNAGTGCRRCPLLRDGFTGWGALDVTSAVRALDGPLPPADAFEPNDDETRAYPVWGLPRTLAATLDWWDDALDVYAVRMRAGQALLATLDGPAGVQTELSLWQGKTTSLDTSSSAASRWLLATQATLTATQRVLAVVPATGTYLVVVRAAQPGSGAYRLKLQRTTP